MKITEDPLIKSFLDNELRNYDLSRQQHLISYLILDGVGNRRIGEIFGLTVESVKNSNTVIFKKIGVVSRSEMISKVYKNILRRVVTPPKIEKVILSKGRV
jgi:DNA-binding NarL/FixJ family response regulator